WKVSNAVDTGGPTWLPESPRTRVAIVAVVVALLLASVGVLVTSGGGAHPRAASQRPTSASPPPPSPPRTPPAVAALPTQTNQMLQYSDTGSTSGPSTHTVTLRPGTKPGQYIETDVFPATGSQQVTIETFSTRGVEVSALQTSSPTGTTNYV